MSSSGDCEKNLNIEVSPNFDRNTSSIASVQIGEFIDYHSHFFVILTIMITSPFLKIYKNLHFSKFFRIEYN